MYNECSTWKADCCLAVTGLNPQLLCLQGEGMFNCTQTSAFRQKAPYQSCTDQNAQLLSTSKSF